uniref:Uncharacterized protein n=1 Tax=Schistosoma curassoni TaxID=6186 RepID=A0A183JM89_9TREM
MFLSEHPTCEIMLVYKVFYYSSHWTTGHQSDWIGLMYESAMNADNR